jgi:nuclear pore complex protein Nup153
MNTLISDAQTNDDPTSTTENDDQPPVKKLCTSNNSFTNTKYQHTNSTDNHRSSNVNALLPEISAVTCIPSTSKQSPKFTSQSSTSLQNHDVGNRSSLKRKSDVIDLSNINRPSSKTPFNFASSTPTVVTGNKQPAIINIKRSLNLDKSSTSNEFLTPTSSKLIKPRENESHQQSSLKFHETSTNHVSSPSFRWDTFVNYGELSERQKLFAQKSPLNCSQVMYGGSSARSNLSKILGNTPPIHRKAVIPISASNNSEIRTTSSILLGHISTKNKEIEENKFIIQPKVHQRHKAEQKNVPIKVESTVKIVETTPEKADDKSSEISSSYSGRVDSNTTRKLRVNLSKKGLGLKSDELEMPTEVNLPRISLPMTALPSINLSNTFTEDNEFTFNQPLTIEQFTSQIAEKTCRKKHKTTMKKSQNTNIEVNSTDQSSTKITSTNFNISTSESSLKETKKVSTTNNDSEIENSNKNDKLSLFSSVVDDPKKNSHKTSLPCSGSTSEFTIPVNKDVNSSPKKLESKNKNQLTPEKSSTELKKKWSCDACWVSNDADIIKCIACQTPKPEKSQTPLLKVIKSSTWTCETCWVPNKNEIEVCVACQTQKPGTTKKTVAQSTTWTCDGCWVKNKSDCTTCISCGTAKPGSAPENKSLPSTQFKFGLNNNTFENSGASQFKFGFDSKADQTSNNQFKFGSATPFTSSENGKLDTSASEFKFGVVNNKTDQPLSTFKFGTNSISSLPVNKLNEGSIINNTDHPETQFKFGFDSKQDQSKNQFKFGQSATTNKPVAQFKFGSDKIETDKSILQNSVVNSNIITPSTNEFKTPVNNKNEESENPFELQNKSNKRKVNDASENSSPQVSFGSVETNCNTSNPLINVGPKNEDLSKVKFVWDKKIEIKPIVNFGSTQPVQSTIENTNQLVNGHSHPNETLNEDQKSGLIKTSQLFSFGSLAKQDQSVPVDQKNQKMFTFGSATNDNKPFTSSIMGTSSFPSTAPVFGASNSMFGSGPITSTPATMGSSIQTPQFSFGSLAPQISNSFFSKTTNDNDKKPLAQTSNSFNSTNNVGFSFGAQSPPVFSVPNVGGLTKMSATDDDQTKCTSNNIFNQPSTKQTAKLDPNAPISINFTGGATTQFTAKPETTEQPPKRKILKPVRRIR